MAHRTSPGPSRIPVPVRSPVTSLNGRHLGHVATENSSPKPTDSYGVAYQENGLLTSSNPNSKSAPSSSRKGKGFETFVMTGDMIIKTTPPHQKSRPSENGKPSTVSEEGKENLVRDHNGSVYSPQSATIPNSPKISSASARSQSNTVPQASLASLEELTDLSQSSTGSDLSENCKGTGSKAEAGTPCKKSKTLEVTDDVDAALSANGSSQSDGHTQETPSSGDSGVLQDSSDSDAGEKYSPGDQKCDKPEKRTMSSSKSAEKIVSTSLPDSRPLVRTSKSHENYLEHGMEFALVNIDIDDNMAYSLDTLTYHESSNASLDKVSETVQSKSLQNSPEKKSEKTTDRVFMPGFINIEEPKDGKISDSHIHSQIKENSFVEKDFNVHSADWNFPTHSAGTPSSKEHSQRDDLQDLRHSGGSSVLAGMNDSESGESTQARNSESEDLDGSDSESLYHQPCKGVDRPSAARLAKRLFHLDGFRKSDVSRHLSKKNEFSNLVAEEYLKYFDLKGDTLDTSLRKFLKQFSLTGETQERERVLAHFSHHYLECNPGAFKSDDACHTLTCAIMLLNTDLHGQAVGRKMTCSEFIDNLAELNDGENFSKEVLKSIFHSIKSEAIEWAVDDELLETGQGDEKMAPQGMAAASGPNPYLDVPDPSKTTEYKKGYVMRKCCMDADKRRTPMGKRGWKMFYAVLRDMVLYLFKDEHQMKKGGFVENVNNALRIHHSLTNKATDYTKKQHVFRLQTADGAEFLFQTSDSKELQEWVDMLNFVAASLSAPPLIGGVGSKTKFQRPLMPIAHTRFNVCEQLQHHEERVVQLEQELHQHQGAAPEKGSKTRVIQDYIEKENYLEFELKRLKTYVYMLQGKLAAYPELEPSLVETAIGEDEEVGSPASASPHKPVQRSLSDRYSYRAAIYQTDRVEYDMI